MYLEVYEHSFYLIQPFANGKFLQKKHVGEEQGIEALDNCDPEPEHRLLYQVKPRLRGWKLWGRFPRHVFVSCFVVKKQTHINKTGGNVGESSYHLLHDSGWYFLDYMLI